MAVIPVATKKFPAGTIFVIEAWAPLAEADGAEVKDASVLDPKIIGFNSDGTVLGAIKMGAGSSAAAAAGVIATLGNALAFDKEGNLYAIDTGIAGGLFDPPIATKGGGAYMFPVSSLDTLAEGQSAAVSYIATPEGGPDGIEVAPDGTIHFNTVGPVAGLKDPADGGMYRVPKEDFKNGTLPAPFARGLGGLDGLDFVGNVRLDTEIKNTNSILVTPTSEAPMLLTYDKDIKLAGPADIAVRKMSDGSYLLVIPELHHLINLTIRLRLFGYRPTSTDLERDIAGGSWPAPSGPSSGSHFIASLAEPPFGRPGRATRARATVRVAPPTP